MSGMDIHQVLATLAGAVDSDETTTKRAATAITKPLTPALDGLREFVDELGDLLGDVEAARDTLDDADDRDDRVDAHAELVANADLLRDHLAGLVAVTQP